jgi:DNA-binding transcriptional LysR family regulator
VDSRVLRTFVTVARCASFSAAADELSLTQAAVSQQIAALEAELGASLLHRRPVVPTEAGRRLLHHARAVLLRLDAARVEVARLSAPGPATLAVGSSPLAFDARAAEAVQAVRSRFPGLEASVYVLSRSAVAEGVATGRLDVGLLDGVVATTDPLGHADVGLLAVEGVAEDDLAVALPVGHPLAGRAALRLHDLVDAPWIDAPDVAGSLDDLRAAAGSGAFAPSLRCDGCDVRALLALVSAGQGLAVIPASVARGAEGIVALPLVSPRLVHRIELFHATVLDEAGAGFVAALDRAPQALRSGQSGR